MKRTPFLLSILVLLTACQTSSQYRNSSVVDYLYSDADSTTISSEIPTLNLPLRVGVAFTPGGYHSATPLTAQARIQLLDSVSQQFRELEFVDTIEVIPSSYLQPRGGFQNLQQLQRMFNLDVIALVSFDQTRFTDEGLASIAYWTIVGAYIVPAEKNATHTMLDAVLYDIKSRKLLFRAPGISQVASKATPVNLQEQIRKDSIKGFELASTNLVENVSAELKRFQQRLEDNPGTVKIVKADGYQGSGDSSWLLLVILVLGSSIAISKRSFRRIKHD